MDTAPANSQCTRVSLLSDYACAFEEIIKCNFPKIQVLSIYNPLATLCVAIYHSLVSNWTLSSCGSVMTGRDGGLPNMTLGSSDSNLLHMCAYVPLTWESSEDYMLVPVVFHARGYSMVTPCKFRYLATMINDNTAE